VKIQYPSSKEIEQLNALFSFNATGQEQDWSIEFSDSSRVSEFLDIYNTVDLTNPQKVEVMNLIIASYDELLTYRPKEQDIWHSIVSAITGDIVLLRNTIEYWSCSGASEYNDFFEVTSRMRMIKDAL